MSKPRRTNKHLPRRLYMKSGAYYYVTAKNKWIKLSRDYQEALLKWAKIEGDTKSGSTLSHALDRYLRECLPVHAETTQREYTRICGVLRKTFGPMSLSDIEPLNIAQYLDRHPHKIAANREISALSSIFTFAIRWGWCRDNPCKKVRKNSEPRRTRYISDSEFSAVRTLAWDHKNENGEYPWRPLAVAMDISYLTAFRLSDVIGIKISDIEGDELRIREGKTGWKARAIVTEELRAVIDLAKDFRRRVSSVYLIVQRNGMPYTASGVKSSWQRLQRFALSSGIISERFHFHDIRAKHATDADEIGINAQLSLGHTDAGTTKRYIRHRKGRKVVPLRSIKN